MSWTPERIAKLEELWAEGLSTAEIGRRLGVSKNAVVGKAHRMKLPGRQSPIESKRTAKPAAGARVGPVGGDGGGGRSLRRLKSFGLLPTRGSISNVGNCIDQLAGLARLGASRTSSNCRARVFSSGSLHRVRSRQVLSALLSSPFPIQAVTNSIRISAPWLSLIGVASASGSSSAMHWP